MNKLFFFVFVAIAVFGIAYGDRFSIPVECHRPNEEYQCGSACQTTCNNLGQPCPIANGRCNDACYCKKGYARVWHHNDPCIPIPKCGTVRSRF